MTEASGNIYEKHSAAFANVSAFVITDSKMHRIATVAFKYPRDGAGRLFCYLHIFGHQMVRGWAGGGGYDKKTAAAIDAAHRIKKGEHGDAETLATFKTALSHDTGPTWDRYLSDAGFTVFQAV